MKLKKTFLIALLSVSLIANSCMKSYAFIGIPSIAAGAVISVLSSWGLTYIFNGHTFSESVQYISDQLDSWGGIADFTDLKISTDGFLVVGASLYNSLRSFAEWLVEDRNITSEGSTVVQSPSITSALFVGSGVELCNGRTLDDFLNSGTLITLQKANPYEKSVLLANGKRINFRVYYNTVRGTYFPQVAYSDAPDTWGNLGEITTFDSLLTNGFKLYINLSSGAANNSTILLFMHNGQLVTYNILTKNYSLGYDAVHFGTSEVGGVAIDAQNISIPDIDIDEQNSALLNLTDISALIGSYARDIASVMDDVIDRTLTVNTYTTIVNEGAVASSLASVESVVETDTLDIAVTDPLPPPSGEDMQLSLRNVFPFCLPFDLYDFFTCLAADPVTPSFDVQIAGIDLHADAHAIDSYVPVFRKFILLGYVITLVVNTKKLLRGDS